MDERAGKSERVAANHAAVAIVVPRACSDAAPATREHARSKSATLTAEAPLLSTGPQLLRRHELWRCHTRRPRAHAVEAQWR